MSTPPVRPLRLVIKFGSGILTRPDTAALDESQFARLTQAIAILKQEGHEVIVVTSGAVAAGLGAMGFVKRPVETGQLQACAAVGQTRYQVTKWKVVSRKRGPCCKAQTSPSMSCPQTHICKMAKATHFKH